MMKEDKGLRFNEGKIRMDLIEASAIEHLAKVFTVGSQKYEEHNWLKGMKWSKVLASLKRHISKFEQGEDLDTETNLYHMAHAAWNALALVSYYKYYPEGDDRLHSYLRSKKIALDLDDCIISWCDAWCEKFNHPIPKDWDFSYDTANNFSTFSKKELELFYSTIPAKIAPKDIGFPIHCYITSRSIDENITKKWIESNGFPAKPVYTVGFGNSKVEAFKESGADWMIDDGYHNFLELTKAGICCFLLTTPHNEKFDVGFKRIKDFKDFKERFL